MAAYSLRNARFSVHMRLLRLVLLLLRCLPMARPLPSCGWYCAHEKGHPKVACGLPAERREAEPPRPHPVPPGYGLGLLVVLPGIPRHHPLGGLAVYRPRPVEVSRVARPLELAHSSPVMSGITTSPRRSVALFGSPFTNVSTFWCVLPSLREAMNCFPALMGRLPAGVTSMASL